MARSNEQTKLKPQLLKSSSFAWDKAFFTSEGVLDADELSSIIEGDGNNVKDQLQPIQQIENLEAKLLQELEEASPKKANKIKTQPTTSRNSSPLSNVKSPTTMATNTTRSKTGKGKADSPSKPHLPSHLGNSNISSRKSSPGSPISPRSSGLSSSTSNQRSSRRSTSVPRRSSSTNARRKDEQKLGNKSIVTLKNKSSPVSHPLSPLGLSNSSSSASLVSSSSSSYKVKPRSISTGRGATIPHRSLNRESSASSSLKTRPTSQTPDRTTKQSTTLYSRTNTALFEDHNTKTGSANGAKQRKIRATKTVQTVSKPNSQRSSSPKPSKVLTSGKERGSSSASKALRSIYLVSPEVLDMKGKLNALKMEISMQKKDKCKETKMVPVKIGKSESCSSIFKNSSSKMNNQARRA